MTNFKWIKPDTPTACITVDKLKRLYLSSEARKLLGVTAPFKLFIGYDHVNKRIVLSKPDIVKLTEVKPFKFDTRGYAHARGFVNELRLPDDDYPLKFEFVGRDLSEYPAGVFCFQLDEFKAPDDKGVIA